MRADITQEIKERVTMRDVLERYGYTADRKGFICCPFHNEKTPSMRIYEKDYHCFGCQEHGDVISFVQKYFDLSFPDALAKIDADFSLGLLGRRMSRREQLALAKERYRKAEEAKQKRNEEEELRQAWLDAEGEYARLFRQFQQYRPKAGDRELHPLFAEALNKIEFVKYQILCAKERLHKYEKSVN